MNDKMAKIESKVNNIETHQHSMINKISELSAGNKIESAHSGNKIADEAIIKEVQIREERKYNAILFNVKEPETNLKEERKRRDIESVNAIIDLCDTTISNESFSNLTRTAR